MKTHLLSTLLRGNMSRQIGAKTAMDHVKNLIQNLQSDGLTPAQLVDALKDRGFEVREGAVDKDWQLKEPGKSQWVSGRDLSDDGSLTWAAIQKQHSTPQQQPLESQQTSSNDTSPDAVQRALEALMELMRNLAVAVQNMVAKLANAILRACGVDYQIALMPGGKPAALRVKSELGDTPDPKGAVKALNDMSRALQNNDSDLLPQPPAGEPDAAQAHQALTEQLALARLAQTPDHAVQLARRAAVQASSTARPGDQEAAITKSVQKMASEVKQYKFDPAEVHQKLRMLQVNGAADIKSVAEKFQDQALSLHAKAMSIVAQDRHAEMTNRPRELSMS